jgi:hypothetical protein
MRQTVARETPSALPASSTDMSATAMFQLYQDHLTVSFVSGARKSDGHAAPGYYRQ